MSFTSTVNAFNQETQRALETHAFSGRALHLYPSYVRALLEVKQAAAKANLTCKVIDAGFAERIDAAIQELTARSSDASVFVADVYQGGGAIAINVNINEAIQAIDHQLQPDLTSLDIRATINVSQSTADVCATAARISLYRQAQSLLDQAQQCADTIEATVKKEFVGTSFMARTCFQDAMPAQLDFFMMAWVSAIRRHAVALGESLMLLSEVNIGGTVIGSGEGAPASYPKVCLTELQKLTGLPLQARANLFDAAQFSDDLLRVGSDVLSLAQTLAKVARDLRYLSSGPLHGFAELALPKLIQGSYFFSAKNNPTLPETVIQGACLINGNYAAMQAATMQSELNLNVFEPMLVFLLSDNMGMLTKLMEKMRLFCLNGLQLGSKGVKRGS